MVFLAQTYAYNVVLCCVALLCVYELVTVFSANKPILLGLTMAVFVALITLLPEDLVARWFVMLVFCFTILYFSIAVVSIEIIDIEKSALMYVMTILLAGGFIAFMMLKSRFEAFGGDANFSFFLCVALPLSGDAFAYFFGSKYGKHKLSPRISPHKSVEGAVASVAFAPLYSLLFLFIYSLTPGYKNGLLCAMGFGKLALVFVILGVFVAFFGIIGDLLASAIKRYCGVKDFGRIMPGHGGMVDRLDSVCFTAPITAFTLIWYWRLLV